jgi:hypothetical protein
LQKDAFFNDSVNLAVGSDGLLSSSDTSSTQQITAILTELAQTAGAVGAREFINVAPDEQIRQIRQKCYSAMNELVKPGPYYIAYPPFETITKKGLPFRVFPLGPSETMDPDKVEIKLTITPFASSKQVKIGAQHPGLIAFFPVPDEAAIVCVVDGNTAKQIYLTAPIILNLYTESHFLDPKRDFLTNPQDTFTFSGGFITGHKYVGQSPAKTIVDTLTAPIRALIPSVSVQQTTQVQTGGGKPDQTTTTTQTTTGAPKSQ